MPDYNPVAIIGMGCLFPNSIGLKNYWQLLFHGKDAITEVPESHWSPAEYYDSDPKRPDHVYCTRGGFLTPVDFDPTEFGIPPNSLEATDTSQLLGLLAAKMALDDCGYNGDRDFNRDRTSVILGVTGTQELVIPLSSRLGHPKWRKALEDSAIPAAKTEEVIRKISDAYVPWQENSFPGLLGNVVAGRICNRLDLRGTNCVVDAACASSMSAVHLSLLELQSGRSDMVVTGGVDTLNDIFMHMCFSKTHTLSATGDARPFSKDADGTVLGEGIGMLVLKRLPEAEKDGDRIYAVIKGLGSSSDGKSQSIYSPRSEGQARALRAAYSNADISPATVQLIEAHGTGTRVGDKVEFSALNQVFEELGANGNKCALGSVKSMIGHTKASAGAAGMIKAALSLYHKVLPPTLKAETPDPDLDIDNSHFYLNTATRPWFSDNGDPRRAGISAFGFGGSNFHVVLEEYQRSKSETSWDGSTEIIAFSATQPDKLIQDLEQFKESVDVGLSETQLSLAAADSRRSFSPDRPYRLLMVCDNMPAIAKLFEQTLKALAAGFDPDAVKIPNVYPGGPQNPGKLAFVFPGQGSQYLHMGRDIACTFPRAMHCLEDADKQLKRSNRLSELIFPPQQQSPREHARQESALRHTENAQPAIGAISLAMFKLLQDFGIEPAATCGHSFGELTALCAAGWIDGPDFLELAATRGCLMAAAGGDQNPPRGSMLAVQAPLADIEALIAESGGNVVLANRNSPVQGVLSGPTADILEFEKTCKARKIKAVRLPVSAAFHSDQLQSAVQPFGDALKQVAIHPTAVEVFSNITANAYPTDPGQVRALLGEQLIHPVDFVSEVENLYHSGVRTFVEIGPKSVLTGLISKTLRKRQFEAAALDASAGAAYGVADLARLLSRLAARGYPVDLNKWENPISSNRQSRMNVPLKGTNFKNQRKDDRSQRAEDREQISEDISQRANVGRQRTDVRRQRAEDRGRKSEDRNQRTDYRGQMSEDRSQRTEVGKLEAMDGSRVLNAPRHFNNQTNSITGKAIANRPIHTMKKETNTQTESIRDAYRVVAEGLKSMQRLQSETAAAHQKFLETQTEANRALQEMMRSTHRLAEGAVEIQSGSNPAVAAPQYGTPAPQVPPPVDNVTEPARVESAADPSRTEIARENDITAPVAADLNIPRAAANGYGEDKKIRDSRAESNPPSPAMQPDLEAKMLDIVSRLTGYPVEMIGLDMDIEADLGIDSIKRVEILSKLEEAIPDLPTVSPDIMGSLKTLGQIVEYMKQPTDGLSDTQPPNQMHQTTPATPAIHAESADNDAESIEATLLDVVSRLTGYPVEMLGMDMDIEAELGIDSIKRVEILSNLEETMPDLPTVSPDIMGSLKTLGQIVEFMGSEKSENSVEHQSEALALDSLAPQAATPVDPVDSRQATVTATLLEVVSGLTGYPVEMLGLDMDIEAELGIDSIKRVEILSSLEENMPDLPAIAPDMIGSLKTLGQIAEYLAAPNVAEAAPESPRTEQATALSVVAAGPPATAPLPELSIDDSDTVTIPRHVVTVVAAPPIAESTIAVPSTKKVFVTEDHTGLAEEIAEELAKRDIKTVRISLDILKYKDRLPAAAGLIIVQDPESGQVHQDIKDAFALAKYLAPDLIATAGEGAGALFATVTRLDGAFGLKGNPLPHPIQGGLAGLAKTAALEWDNVCCHAIDIAPDWPDKPALAAAVVKEVLAPGPVEIGLESENRKTLALEPATRATGSLNLDQKDVVVVSGGARGVTAAAALALARETGTQLVLLGRSPEPFAEPAWLAALEGEADIKKALLENEFSSQSPTPAAVDKVYHRYMTNREITHNLTQLRSVGTRVEYFSTDVRKYDEVAAIMDGIREDLGPVTGIIHGAGVLEDRLITDKTAEQFERVYDTKVAGLNNLLQSSSREPLKYLVLFSSVAARLGNKGQVDYAIANEVLNKVALNESATRANCRVIAINWGPWDGGMVTAPLKREFERNGIHLIPVDYGADCMLDEMKAPGDSPVEIVIGAELPKADLPSRTAPKRPELVKAVPAAKKQQLALSFERQIDLEHYPILQSHIIDGKPVVPLALMTEWLAHGALHENPGLLLHGLDDMRVMKGIRMEHDQKHIRLLTGKLQKHGGHYEVAVELRDGKPSGSDMVHAAARAVLSDSLAEGPDYHFPKTMVAKAYTKKIKEVYDQILFHGMQLHGIRKIVSCSARGMVAHIAAAPAPSEWMSSPLRNQWIADPLVLDCAFQMATVWCFEEKGAVSLPSYGSSYRQYCAQFPADGVTVVLEIKDVTSRRMRGDFTFLDAEGAIVARLNGYEAIMDASLFRAFKPQYRASA
ncbi:omega-3 polyunsaturated fatty acid synthase subunit, PfaA [Olavius algarvensis Delta 1 endosymbiont]|nr:omega-3 polyunsaturated fatty acid synthase subunit, PfaA [Olavius algarvensis Delta 1 endosymbiont]